MTQQEVDWRMKDIKKLEIRTVFESELISWLFISKISTGDQTVFESEFISWLRFLIIPISFQRDLAIKK